MLVATGKLSTSFKIPLNQEMVPAVGELLSLSVPFIAYNAKLFLFCVWALGLKEPETIWDSYIFEKVRFLGCFNKRYYVDPRDGDLRFVLAKEKATDEKHIRLSIDRICLDYNVCLDCFINVDSVSRDASQIAALVRSLAKLYPLQIEKAKELDLLQYCLKVEMPWVITNASMEWIGVKVDYDRAETISSRVKPIADKLKDKLQTDFAINNPRSPKDLKEFFQREGLGHYFMKYGSSTFDEDTLKYHQHVHPAIPVILKSRKLLDILSQKILNPAIASSVDGRVHPNHIQLGADTGRQTCVHPSVAGIGRYLKPIIVPRDGYGLGEIDFCQIEPGISGAYYGDFELIKMYNEGDVYTCMAKTFFDKTLTEEDLMLDFHEFKNKYPVLRNKMKTFHLSVTYGRGATSLAAEYKMDIDEATKMLDDFKAMFPQLTEAIQKQHRLQNTSKYVEILCGLKRYKGFQRFPDNHLRFWERNWFVNTPIQGSCAIIFKTAGNEIYQMFKEYDAHLLIPVHDSFVFEAPLEILSTVAKLAADIMTKTLTEYFPVLQPRVDINISYPECWNKDGCLDFFVDGDGTLKEIKASDDIDRQQKFSHQPYIYYIIGLVGKFV